jgi:heme A synthase
MSWNKWIRWTHRWLSVAFTLAVIINGIAVVRGKYSTGLGLMAVAVLALMFLTGAYLFVLPYAAKWRRGRTLATQSQA